MIERMRKRLTVLALAAVFTLGLAACGGEEAAKEPSGGSAAPLGNTVYQADDVAWSSDLKSLYGGCVSGEWMFLAGSYAGEHGDTGTIRRLALTGGEAEALPAYQPLEFPEEKWVSLNIFDIRAGEDGTVWVHEIYPSAHALRQLDAEGKELFRFTTKGRGLDGSISCMAAGGGDIAVLTEKDAVLFDREGEELFTLPLDGEYPALVRLGDGRLGVYDNYHGVDGYYAKRLRVIDKSKKDWGETYHIPAQAFQVFGGQGEVLFYYILNNYLMAVRAGETEPERVLDWMRTGMDGAKAAFLSFLPDGRLAVMSRGQGGAFTASSFIFSMLTPADPATLPEKTVLTYATMDMVTSEQEAVTAFNRDSQEYYIEVTDYNQEYGPAGRAAGRTRLATEIAAGKVPDIINIDALGGEQWGAAGLFEDLWPYIDADPDFGREDLMERVFQAYEEDGKLYGISGRFRIQTLAGAREVVGDRMTWTPEDLWAALEKFPEGSSALGVNGTQKTMLQFMAGFGMERFLDWSAGTCDFESREFKELLAFCGDFPEEPPISDYKAEEDALMDGEQMLCNWSLVSLQTIQDMKFLLGGGISFVGYPNEDGRVGSAFDLDTRLAISSASEHKDGAWAFLRKLLLPDPSLTKDNCNYFPTNRADFEKMAELCMTPELDKNGKEVQCSMTSFGTENAPMYYRAATQEEYGQFMELYNAIDSAGRCDENIIEIVLDQAGAYFAGDKTLDETASLIQSRAELYMGEQK